MSNSWLCSKKLGIIEENYQDPDMFVNYHGEDNANSYNFLCVFHYQFSLDQQQYSLEILYPNCQFYDNDLMRVKLLDLSSNEYLNAQEYHFKYPDHDYSIDAIDINVNQNVNHYFATNLYSSDMINLNINNMQDVDIALSGLQEGFISSC